MKILTGLFSNNIQNNQPDCNISVVYSPSELIKEFIHKNKNLFKNNSESGQGLHTEYMSHIGISSLQFDNNNKLYIVVNKISIFRFDEKRNVMERIFNYNQQFNNAIHYSLSVRQTNLENKLSNTTIDNTASDLKINQFDFDKDNNLYFTSNSDYILKLNTETLKLSIFKNIADSRKDGEITTAYISTMKFDNYGDLYFLGEGALYTASDTLNRIRTDYSDSGADVDWKDPLLLSSYKVPNNSYKIQHLSEIETIAEIIDDTDLVTSISNQQQLIIDNNKNIYVGLSDSTPSESDLSLDNIRIKRYNFIPNSNPNLDSNLLDTNFNFFAIDSLTNIEFNSSSNQFQQTSGSSINSKSILIDKDSLQQCILYFK